MDNSLFQLRLPKNDNSEEERMFEGENTLIIFWKSCSEQTRFTIGIVMINFSE
jgi:hypothetical protein